MGNCCCRGNGDDAPALCSTRRRSASLAPKRYVPINLLFIGRIVKGALFASVLPHTFVSTYCSVEEFVPFLAGILSLFCPLLAQICFDVCTKKFPEFSHFGTQWGMEVRWPPGSQHVSIFFPDGGSVQAVIIPTKCYCRIYTISVFRSRNSASAPRTSRPSWGMAGAIRSALATGGKHVVGLKRIMCRIR